MVSSIKLVSLNFIFCLCYPVILIPSFTHSQGFFLYELEKSCCFSKLKCISWGGGGSGVTICTPSFEACWDLSLASYRSRRVGVGSEEYHLCLAMMTSREAITESSCKAEFTPIEGRRCTSASKGDPAEFRGSVSPASLRELHTFSHSNFKNLISS